MADVPAAMAREDARRLTDLCAALEAASGASWAAVVGADGHFLACGRRSPPLDTTLMASLVAGGTAAIGAIAEQVAEAHFPAMLLEGERTSLYLAKVGAKGTLVVAFDDRSATALVRLKTGQAADEISRVVDRIERPPTHKATALDITDADIDALFGA